MIRSLKQAKYEDSLTYYRSDCDYCKSDLVISQNDLFVTFYGMPEVNDDECVYKCPECGHVNVRKLKNLQICKQNGTPTYENVYIFGKYKKQNTDTCLLFHNKENDIMYKVYTNGLGYMSEQFQTKINKTYIIEKNYLVALEHIINEIIKDFKNIKIDVQYRGQLENQ